MSQKPKTKQILTKISTPLQLVSPTKKLSRVSKLSETSVTSSRDQTPFDPVHAITSNPVVNQAIMFMQDRPKMIEDAKAQGNKWFEELIEQPDLRFDVKKMRASEIANVSHVPDFSLVNFLELSD